MILSPTCQARNILRLLNKSIPNDMENNLYHFLSSQTQSFKDILDTLINLACNFKDIYSSQQRIADLTNKTFKTNYTRETVNRVLKDLNEYNLVVKTQRGTKKTCLYEVSPLFFFKTNAHHLKDIFKSLKTYLWVSFLLTLSTGMITQDNKNFYIKNFNNKGREMSHVRNEKDISHNLNQDPKINTLLSNSGFKNTVDKQVEKNKFNNLQEFNIHNVPNAKQTDELLKKINVDLDPFAETIKFLTDYKIGKFEKVDSVFEQWFYANLYPTFVTQVLNSDIYGLSDSQQFIYNLTVEHHNIIKPHDKKEKINCHLGS